MTSPKTTTAEVRGIEGLPPESLFGKIAPEPGTVWLDSSSQTDLANSRSYIGRHPVAELVWDEDGTTVCHPGTEPKQTQQHILELIEEIIQQTDQFVCGFFSYEGCLELAGLSPAIPSNGTPKARFFVYNSLLEYDHADETYPSVPEYNDMLCGLPDPPKVSRCNTVEESPLPDFYLKECEYKDRIRRIKEHIREGDIYQANFTSGLELRSSQNPLDVYRRLRRTSPSNYGAYMNFSDMTILSASPERMITKSGSHLLTSPIKGTIARGGGIEEEAKQRNRLLSSAKDRAELLMIVDLERNDLGAIARTGTVSVDSIFRPEVYSSVIHLVSDISAELRPGVSLRQLFEAILPGGSVTGAPKRRAMEIISELESGPRGVYTGCIGYFHKDRIDMNLAIRTIVHRDGIYYAHAGGGIVADSDPDLEYQEMQLKMLGMLKALGVAK
ncbi:MAG TPA: anthranilate synthase component I family protein [candidate division Zixibacteria bacterium]|nr:anthranilate synthase component I family protein [candidate division Zixibacteria bacterium]